MLSSLLAGNHLFSQNSHEDSLLNVIANNNTDTGAVKAYLHLGNSHYRTSADSAIYYWGVCRDLGIKLKQNYQNKEANLDLTQSIASALNNMGYIFSYRGDTTSGIAMHIQASELSKSINDDNGLSYAYYNLGLAYSRFGRYLLALDYYKQTELIRIKTKDSKGLASVYESMATCYEKLGDAHIAFDFHNKALEISEEMADSNHLALIYSNMGVLYAQQNELDHALSSYDKSYKIRLAINDQRGAAHSLANFGAGQLSFKLYNESIESFQSCLLILNKVPDYALLGNVYNNLGNAYENSGLKDSALIYYEKSITVNTNTNNKNGKVYALVNIAGLYHRTSKPANGLPYAIEALDLAKEINALEGQRQSAEILSKIYVDLKQWEASFTTYQFYIELRDSLARKENQRAALSQETRYKYQQKVKADSLKSLQDRAITELKIDKKNAEIDSRESTIRSLIVLAILIISLVLVLIIMYRRKTKTAAEINSQKETIEKRNEEKELLLKEIHHRVKNNLQIITGLLELQSIELDDDVYTAAMLDGQSRVKSMALIHEKLYQHEHLASIDMANYCRELTNQIGASYAKGQNIEVSIDCNAIHLDIDSAIPIGLILNEMITNSWKYAFSGNSHGVISILIEQKGQGEYLLEYADDGPGLSSDINPVKFKSLGLRLIGRLTKQLFGKFEYLGKENEGVHYRIMFYDTVTRKQKI